MKVHYNFNMPKGISYKSSGVDISKADKTKKCFGKSLETKDTRVLNRIGAFASLYDASFPGIDYPVLVLKTEEPGSKQLLAFQEGNIEGICEDMMNHLINDIIVMGATPLSVQDAVICGKMEPRIVERIVAGIAKACRSQGCTLTGGETSEQPGMLDAGKYILTSSIVGVVDRTKIIDGSAIREGDSVLSLESSGLHTNGYSLVRTLMKKKPRILKERIGKSSFMNTILVPHRCYYHPLKNLFGDSGLHGLAHITGGGIGGNLNRILPKGLNAEIDLSALDVPEIFRIIRRYAGINDAQMLQTYNLGVGMALVCAPNAVERMQTHLKKRKVKTAVIGHIVKGKQDVTFAASLDCR